MPVRQAREARTMADIDAKVVQVGQLEVGDKHDRHCAANLRAAAGRRVSFAAADRQAPGQALRRGPTCTRPAASPVVLAYSRPGIGVHQLHDSRPCTEETEAPIADRLASSTAHSTAAGLAALHLLPVTQRHAVAAYTSLAASCGTRSAAAPTTRQVSAARAASVSAQKLEVH